MIFRQCQQVLDGDKTQTRRVVKYGDMIETGDEQLWFMMHSAPRLGSMVQGGRCQIPTVVLRYKYKPYRIKWQVGRDYAIQPGRGKKAVGRIRITEIRKGRVQEINRLDLKAEGIDYDSIVGAYDRYWVARQRFAELWDSIYTQKAECWEDNPEVWVLTFEGLEKKGKQP